MEGLLIYLAFGLIMAGALVSHVRRFRARESAARRASLAAGPGGEGGEGPRGQHPHIDATWCIGCGGCIEVCPEGEVLALVGGKAAVVNGPRCIGHGLCAEACPVGAIEMVMAPPSVSADLPALSPEFETSVPNLFVVGELGGLALIQNAVNQGRDCVEVIARRLPALRGRPRADAVADVCIVGAGPGGLSASLRAIELKLRYVTLEQDEFGGTVAKYPRQKLVLTSPVEFPFHGKFRKLEISKEDLLEFWHRIARRAGLEVRTGERVEEVRRDPDGAFTVITGKGSYRALTVILAIGRRGSPRKLGVPGEELPKVMYSLLDAEAYSGCRIVVVGGGDSAVEAAMGLARQPGNLVTLSYRREAFSRLKERNARKIEEHLRHRKLEVVFESQLVEIRDREVVLEVRGERRTIPNDYVWVFAGGTPPNAFLERIGVALGPRDLTAEAGQEALRVV